MTRIFHHDKMSSVCSIHPSRAISCSFDSPQTSSKVKTLLTKTASAPPLNTPCQWASCSASPPNWTRTTYRHGCPLSPFSLPLPLTLHTPSPVSLLCPFQMLPTQYVLAERDKTLKVSRSGTGTGSRSRDRVYRVSCLPSKVLALICRAKGSSVGSI
jgi:hypothetical protein